MSGTSFTEIGFVVLGKKILKSHKNEFGELLFRSFAFQTFAFRTFAFRTVAFRTVAFRTVTALV